MKNSGIIVRKFVFKIRGKSTIYIYIYKFTCVSVFSFYSELWALGKIITSRKSDL